MTPLMVITTIMELIPLAQRIAVEINGVKQQFDVSNVTKADLEQALGDSKVWPDLKFQSPS